MLPYLIPVVVIILGVIFYDAQGVQRNRKWLYWSVYVYFVLLYGLRYRIGGDTAHYMMYFSTFPDLRLFSLSTMEEYGFIQPGYQLLWATMRSISPDFWPYQIVHGIIINFAVMYWITRRTKYWFTGLLIYALCYSLYFNTEIMRESFSICIFLYIYKYMREHKWLKYYLGVCLAILFHISATILILFPLVEILKLKIDVKFIIIMSIVLVLFMVLKNQVMEVAFRLGGSVGSKLLYYTSQFDKGDLTVNWIYFRVIRYCVFPLIVAGVWKLGFKQPLRYEGLICLYIIFGAGVIILQEVCVRFTNYPMPFFYMALTSMIATGIRRVSRHKTFAYTLLVITMGLSMYNSVRNDILYNLYTPYKTVFTMETDPIRESTIN